MRKLLLGAVLVAVGSISLGWVQGAGAQGKAAPDSESPTVSMPVDEIIAARQAAYDLMAADFGAMKRAVEAHADPKPLADGAKAIARWGHAVPAMFPPGTDKGHDTKAKPDIWSDRAGFEKAAANLGMQADKLAQAADSGDKDAFAAQWKATGDACGACHRVYRAR
jgi:cytochrome c556